MAINFFMMSMRFNKSTPEDFGLVQTDDSGVYIMQSDNSLWKKRDLYDFGWGKENGYYRLPLPCFDDLVSIILNSNLKNNKYGAAAIILDDYCEELYDKCDEILKDTQKVDEYSEFFSILQLEKPINRSTIVGKRSIQVSEDYNKWEEISKRLGKQEKL